MPQLPPSPRYVALDGLRGLAAIYVVIYHANWQSHLTPLQFFGNGYLAVDLFFIISGFVIAAAYADRLRSAAGVRDFLVLRFFRVYPVHAFTLAILVGLELQRLLAPYWGGTVGARASFTGARSWELLAAHVFLVQGLGVTDVIGWNAPSWSISCEFLAYVLFALAVVAPRTRRLMRAPVVLALSLALYAAVMLNWGSLGAAAFVPRCLAGFVLGVALYRLTRDARVTGALTTTSVRARAVLDLIVAAGLLVALALSSGASTIAVVPMFAAVVLLSSAGEGPVLRFLASRPVQYLGRVSYPVYMLHAVVLIRFPQVVRAMGQPTNEVRLPDDRLVFPTDPSAGDLLMIVLLAAVLALAHPLHRWVEDPCRRFGRRLVARLQPAPALRPAPLAA